MREGLQGVDDCFRSRHWRWCKTFNAHVTEGSNRNHITSLKHQPQTSNACAIFQPPFTTIYRHVSNRSSREYLSLAIDSASEMHTSTPEYHHIPQKIPPPDRKREASLGSVEHVRRSLIYLPAYIHPRLSVKSPERLKSQAVGAKCTIASGLESNPSIETGRHRA